MAEFLVGDQYTRDEIAERVGMAVERRTGGAWATGYDEWGGEAFVFVNVGGPGRTGHDYGNRWQGKDLIWFGKTGSRRGQPQIDRLISNTIPVHVFWRGRDRSPFTYAGLARAVSATADTPVEVHWTFSTSAVPASAPSQEEAEPKWHRGPPPVAGSTQAVRLDGPTQVYLLRLAGPLQGMLDVPRDHSVIKIGMSRDVGRRLAELNQGFPPGSRVKWQVISARTYPSGPEAFAVEGEILEALRRAEAWIGGEFAVVSDDDLEKLLPIEETA